VTASQDELVVHETSLDGSETLAQESFLSRGEGSHFVSRVSELVLVRPTVAGLALLPDKVEQLVAKGLHNIIVSLEGLGSLEGDTLQVLMRVKAYLENWAGSLRVCGADPSAELKLSVLGTAEGLAMFPDVQACLSDYKAALADSEQRDAGSTELEEIDDDFATRTMIHDEWAPPPVEDPEDWGWGSSESSAPSQSAVDASELLVEADELPKLQRELRKMVARDKRYITLRLHFERAMRADDVDLLAGCRDFLAAEGGQLVFVSLQYEVLKWLKLLGFDREFLILETADEAERAHARHAAGEAPLRTAPARDEAPFAIVEEGAHHFVVRPRGLVGRSSVKRTSMEIPLIGVKGETLSGLPGRLRGSSARAAIVDLARVTGADAKGLRPLGDAVAVAHAGNGLLAFGNATREVQAMARVLGLKSPIELSLRAAVAALAGLLHARDAFEELSLDLSLETLQESGEQLISDSGIEFDSGFSVDVLDDSSSAELDALRAQLAKAKAECSRLSDELSAERQRAKKAEQEQERFQREALELSGASRRDERRIMELEQARERAEHRATQAETLQSSSKKDTGRLEGELTRLRQELDQARAAAASGGAAASQLQDLQAQLAAQHERFQKELKKREDALDQLESLAKQARAAAKTARQELRDTDADELRERVLALQEEKALILAEAEEEIERLTAERELLRSELESAGEMIERMGKELELS